MKRFFAILIGLALVGVAAAWFLGPLQDMIMGQDLSPIAGEEGFSTRSRSLRRPKESGLDVNTVLNGVNAVVGLSGLVIALRGGRSKA